MRLKKGKKTYEVMVQEGMVAKYREGSVKRLDDVLVTPLVFTNASKGTRASAEQLNESFQTDNVEAVITTILEKGEAQESAGERREKMDAKKQEILTVIQKNYVSPDGRPLPMSRIENAVEQIKARIDVDQDATRQVTAMIPKLSAVMPMKKGSGGLQGTVTVASKLVGAVSGIVRKHATVLRETYGAQAKYDLEIHSYDQLMSDLARVTKGDFNFSLASNGAGASASTDAPPPQAGNGKKGKGKKKRK